MDDLIEFPHFTFHVTTRGVRAMNTNSFNVNHHSVKRILREVKEFQKEQDPDLVAVPLEVRMITPASTLTLAHDTDSPP